MVLRCVLTKVCQHIFVTGHFYRIGESEWNLDLNICKVNEHQIGTDSNHYKDSVSNLTKNSFKKRLRLSPKCSEEQISFNFFFQQWDNSQLNSATKWFKGLHRFFFRFFNFFFLQLFSLDTSVWAQRGVPPERIVGWSFAWIEVNSMIAMRK